LESRNEKKLLPCLWCVLYTVANPQIVYRGGTQAKKLRKELNKRTPPNAVIVDYEFYKNHSTAEDGWLFIWKVQCDHSSNFRKVDDKGEMSVVTMGGTISNL
jgi:hypothetical protein